MVIEKEFVKATLVVGSASYHNNKIFSSDPLINTDNRNSTFIELKKYLSQYNIEIATEDIHPREQSQIIIELNIPSENYKKKENQLHYLILHEPIVVLKKNWLKENHSGYDKIFVWDKSLVDNVKYFQLNLSFHIEPFKNIDFEKPRNLLTMISGYKQSSHKLELYSERVKAVLWFSKKCGQQFDLYGVGWKDYLLPPFLERIERFYDQTILREYLLPPALGRKERTIRKKILKTLFPNKAYQGTVFSKWETLRNYKFAICYENMKDTQNYITEKIFDCFSSGCVPIYWGASDILNYIPGNCFIDKRKFENYNDLFKYISEIKESEYMTYIENIKMFLQTNDCYEFNAENYAKRLVDFIVKDYDLIKLKIAI